MNTLNVRVLRKTREALDVTSFELAALEPPGLPAFAAGAHIDVTKPGGLDAPGGRRRRGP
jgi:vanillate O-demethylase ferredoxin subunit